MIKSEDSLIHTMLKEVNFDFEIIGTTLPPGPYPWPVSKSFSFTYKNENIQFIIHVQKCGNDSPSFMVFVERLTKLFVFVNCTLHSNGLHIVNDKITKTSGIWTCTPEDPDTMRYESYKFVLKSIVGFEMASLQECPLNLPLKFSSPSEISSSAKHLSGIISNSKDVAISCRNLSDDFLHFYQEGKLSDATLNTEGKTFPVHRSILAARSSVFRAMFEKDQMKEGLTGVIEIEDMDSETVDRMLVFLYGDKLGNVNWEEASALYYAADKYDVQTLKQKCADILKAGLTAGNACEALVLADRHSDEELMKCAVDFIRDHQEVLSSTEWNKLEENNLRLAANIMRKILVNGVDK